MIDLLGYAAFFLSTALILGIITLGLNLQWGLTGLFNVGIAGFVAIGAYTSAILTTPEAADRVGGFGWPILAGWVAAMAITGLAAGLTGFATLRLKSDYLAITTFGVAVVVQLVTLNAQGLTGGPFGVAFIPRPFASLAETPVAFNFANLAVVAAVPVVVRSAAVPRPAAVRYGWSDNPADADLINTAQLPASPFRSDNW